MGTPDRAEVARAYGSTDADELCDRWCDAAAFEWLVIATGAEVDDVAAFINEFEVDPGQLLWLVTNCLTPYDFPGELM